jgi:DNA repair exonuclease SbcCD ATPase subunit
MPVEEYERWQRSSTDVQVLLVKRSKYAPGEENELFREQITAMQGEIERLRADADRLTAEVAVQVRRAIKAESERDGDLLAENERLRKVEQHFSDELGFTDFADGIGPVYATADQMIEQIRREREQSEEYWAEIERLRKSEARAVNGYHNAMVDNKILKAKIERLRNRIEDFKKTRSFGKILELEDEIERLQGRVLELEGDRRELLAEHDPFNPLLEESDGP